MTSLAPARSPLLHNLVLFGRALRGAGLAVDPTSMLALVRALEHVDIRRRNDLYMAARCTLVRRRQDLPIFDEVFRIFWRQPKDSTSTLDLRSLGEQRRYRKPQVDVPRSDDEGPEDEAGAKRRPVHRVALTGVYNAQEVLQQKTFPVHA